MSELRFKPGDLVLAEAVITRADPDDRELPYKITLNGTSQWIAEKYLRPVLSASPCCGSVHEFHLLGCAEGGGK